MADYSYNDDKYELFEDDDFSSDLNTKERVNGAKSSEISESSAQDEPRLKGFMRGVKWLSLGISIIVAIALGIALGWFLKYLFDTIWVFWLGVFWGVCAAILNIYKAYKYQLKDFERLSNSPKYRYKGD